jgi:Terminase large subunit, endonuclease domain
MCRASKELAGRKPGSIVPVKKDFRPTDETDAVDNWKPSKKKSRERIDGIVALIMVLERATVGDGPVYWSHENGVSL